LQYLFYFIANVWTALDNDTSDSRRVMAKNQKNCMVQMQKNWLSSEFGTRFQS